MPDSREAEHDPKNCPDVKCRICHDIIAEAFKSAKPVGDLAAQFGADSERVTDDPIGETYTTRVARDINGDPLIHSFSILATRRDGLGNSVSLGSGRSGSLECLLTVADVGTTALPLPDGDVLLDAATELNRLLGIVLRIATERGIAVPARRFGPEIKKPSGG